MGSPERFFSQIQSQPQDKGYTSPDIPILLAPQTPELNTVNVEVPPVDIVSSDSHVGQHNEKDNEQLANLTQDKPHSSEDLSGQAKQEEKIDRRRPIRSILERFNFIDRPTDPVRRALVFGGLGTFLTACVEKAFPSIQSLEPAQETVPTYPPTPSQKAAAPEKKEATTFVPKGFPEPPVPLKPEGNMSVGIYYLTGWGTFEGRSSDWRLGTPFNPLLGFYKSDDPRIADWHIYWLLENGRSHVMIPSTDPSVYGWTTNFERGFLNSSLLPHIEFSIMFNNEPYWPGNPWGNNSDRLDDLTRNTISYYAENYFSHPRYRKIDKKPLLTLYHAFIIEGHPELGFDRLRRVVEDIRETSLRHGYEVFLVGDIMSTWMGDDASSINHAQRLLGLFDAASSYAVINAGRTPPNEWDYDEQGNVHLIEPYDTMVKGYMELNQWWSEQAKRAAKGFIPAITPGFDNEVVWRRKIDNWLAKRTDPTPEKYVDMIQGVKDFVDPDLKMIYEEAFNEFQEGAVVEPTKENGFAYLNVSRNVLYQEPQSGWRPNLLPTEDGKIVVFETGEPWQP